MGSSTGTSKYQEPIIVFSSLGQPKVARPDVIT